MGLPSDFRWGERWGGRPTLSYNGHELANIQPSGGAWSVHLSRSPMDHDKHQVQVATRELAIRYIEAWAVRWEQQLRQAHSWVTSNPEDRPAADIPEGASPVATTHIRHRHGRRGPLG